MKSINLTVRTKKMNQQSSCWIGLCILDQKIGQLIICLLISWSNCNIPL